jgi:hypothetical protein
MGWIRKIQKHKEKRGRSGKLEKTRRKEWRKEKQEIYWLHATLPQDNPLVLEPPLQQKLVDTCFYLTILG